MDDKVELTFSEQMKMLRERSGKTSRQVSLEANLSPSYFSKVENGTLKPTVASFAKLVRILNATPSEIYYILFSVSEGESD